LYKGESFAVGIGANYNGEEVKVGSNGIGYGNDSDSHHSITKSGINTANIIITNKEQQQALTGKSVEETIQAVKTDVSTDNYTQYSGSLKNNFDKDKVQNEIDLQVEVTQEFGRNVQDLNRRKNIELDELKEELKSGKKTQEEYDQAVKKIETEKAIINMLAGGLMLPSDGALGIATSAVSPAVSFQVGQHFKKEGKEGSFEHIATHAVIGALTSVANGGNALSGAVSAGSAEYIAKVTAETLFKKDAKDLTADEKQTVSSISQIVGILSGSLTGDSSANAYIGGNVATNAVENNAINGLDGFTPDERIQNKFLSSCIKSSSKQECQRRLNEKEWENTKKIISTVADFVPIIGDIKGFAEAETKGDYFFATLAVIPIFGDGAKKVHDAHKAYEAAKAVKDVEKMKEAMQVASMQIKLPIPVTAQQKRNSAGTSFSSTSLVELKIGESLFKGNNYAPVPKQIADKLSVKHFNSFDEFRQEFWKLMADDPAVAKNFNSSNLKRMKQGYAPFAPKNQHNGQNKKYELDHNIEIRDGGSVYNLDNIIIRTPLDHANKTRNRKQ
ncbi:MAG: VENN motif pre-toxin domain-containing protein, partial [Neisseriaceae bacterium]|nr:VENN motif pre-toxin domain-containing protein [Neisseriaceae bacterium]